MSIKEFSAEEIEERKRAVFEAMSPRRQKHIVKRGYEKWDPFQEPKDPIEIRRDKSRRTTQMLVREFLQSWDGEQSNAFSQGVLEMAMGMVNEDERYLGMYAFCRWYRNLLRREGLE